MVGYRPTGSSDGGKQTPFRGAPTQAPKPQQSQITQTHLNKPAQRNNPTPKDEA